MEDLGQTSNLGLVEGVWELHTKVDVQVALVERLRVHGHALILDALPAVRLDDMACRAGDLQHSAIQMCDVELDPRQRLCQSDFLQDHWINLLDGSW